MVFETVMKKNGKTRICHCCEGELERDATECRYCGALLLSRADEEETRESLEETGEAPSSFGHFSFVLGCFLLTLAFIALLFSHRGKVRIELNTHYAFLWGVIGSLFLFFGLRRLPRD